MSKRHKIPPVNLQDFKDKLYKDGAIPVVTDAGTFYIKPPELLTDADWDTFSKSDDEMVQAKLLVDDYDGFVAAGGSAILVGVLIEEQAKADKQEQGADQGEEGASSAS